MDQYPAPSEAARKRRQRKRSAGQSGSSFYIERGRDFVGMNEYRERRRDPVARQAVKLSRELSKLAAEYPRFRLSLNRLGHHVLLQVRSASWKTRTILKCLDHEEAVSVKEISEISGLDFVSVTTTLGELRAADQVLACNRLGRPLLVDQGRSVYWLKK